MNNRLAITCAAAILAVAGNVPVASALPAAPGLVAPAATVTPTSFTAQQSGSNWTITFSRDLSFSAFEVRNQFPFQGWAELWEQDESDDDFISRTRVSNITPSSGGLTQTATFRPTSSQLDTELGGEEIYAKAFLKNLETGQVFQVASHRIQISP
ncbi:hypothetical protein [Streptomyces glaucescens]|uniref:Putative thiopeptide-lantipeptide biosynthesis related protein n=1 Tax=Streptomyces glaucescens TaxID=1907 RepID=A0A089YR86_STRGA|nr:hypothetical protein [Streptomyces glaucescens]AIR96180.1 putative thiopeptide-lantipeptide biosynthesis related protein [Streptomyces glaucescens]